MSSTTKALSDHDRRIFHHNFAVTTLLVSAADSGETESAMTFADHERNVCFINDAKEQRHWLSCELSNLDSYSENYKTNQRSIRGAIRELDKVIWIATRRPGHGGSRQMTVRPDGISALELTGAGSNRSAPAK